MLKLGPEGFKNIAIMGSAPSTTMLAPFGDQSWSIWACSPGTFAQIATKRSDVWFEPHRWLPYLPGQSGAAGTRPWFSPEFQAFLAQHKGPTFMTDQRCLQDPGTAEELHEKFGCVHETIPNSTPFPYEMLLRKHGPYMWTSTIAWMLALALEYRPESIGLFGIDMAANSEWAYQRPACQHFVGLARMMGIKVVLPPESDLMRPSTMYGIGEHNERHVKIRERMIEFDGQKNACQQQLEVAKLNFKYYEGATEALKYMLEVWTDDIRPNPEHAISFSGAYVGIGKISANGSTGAELLDLAKRA